MEKKTFASPLLDSTFKLVFGEKNHEQITIDFLNDLLERTDKENEIKEIEFCHQELTPRKLDDKKSILDINCTDARGHQFIIEIQRRSEDYFDWRLFYYASSILSRQLQETNSYGQLKPVIILGILNFKLSEQGNEPITHHKMCDMRTGKQSINLIELHIVELGKFEKKVDQLVTHIDKWLFFLKEAHKQDAIPTTCDDVPAIRNAFNIMARWNWTKEQIAVYEKEVMEFRIGITQELSHAEKIEVAKKEGIGIGIDKGKQEQAIETAIESLKEGLKIDLIAKITGLSIAEIQKLSVYTTNKSVKS